MSVGIEAGGLSSVPSGDDLESSLSQNLACCLSSIRLLWDKSQQYCHKWSRLQKSLGKWSPEKPCKLVGRIGETCITLSCGELLP